MGSPKVIAVTIVLALSIMHVLLVQGLECEKVPVGYCAYSVSSAGIRCVLEYKYSSAAVQHECQSSGILTENIKEWIESDECLDACGLSRNSVGMSSDDLSNHQFTSKLCSVNCINSCPNIKELYFNLAAGEGISLPNICETVKKVPDLNGADAPAPSISLE
ncbi:hypothetical protein SUGI_0775420 [Cryptomeria japonica]|uniref:uncharacterized protein LOC131076400 n=1 Tax=Cryptomeria japonica TaxID=3369 RepID=UPI0024148800|nr:uncharacterized protein LOC131076400 [Cryptomeria japonica]GLJ38091.1 hypothetical protein SUGI_0775420 [Cryptomeria japonica]